MAYTKEEMEFLQSQNIPVKPSTVGASFEELDLMQRSLVPPPPEFRGFLNLLSEAFGEDILEGREQPDDVTLEDLKKDTQETLESMYRGLLHDLEHVQEATNAGEVWFHAGHAAALETCMWILTDDVFPHIISNAQRFEHDMGMSHHIVAENGQLEVKSGDLIKETAGKKLEAVADYLHNIRIDATTGKVIEEQTEDHECRCESTEDLMKEIMDAVAGLRLDIDNLKNEVYNDLEFEAEMARSAFDGDDGIMEHHFFDEPMSDDLEF